MDLPFADLADQQGSFWLIGYVARPPFHQEESGCFSVRFSLKIRYGFGLSEWGLVNASQPYSQSRGLCCSDSLVSHEARARVLHALTKAARLAKVMGTGILELVSAWLLPQTSYARVLLI